mmetsp:Transcript_114299/g.334181  ORF Transcript_114299/g.334181 Transcript_114299/m.334181 type:complete len:213 (+) Transcript_114299:68-706(+)
MPTALRPPKHACNEHSRKQSVLYHFTTHTCKPHRRRICQWKTSFAAQCGKLQLRRNMRSASATQSALLTHREGLQLSQVLSCVSPSPQHRGHIFPHLRRPRNDNMSARAGQRQHGVQHLPTHAAPQASLLVGTYAQWPCLGPERPRVRGEPVMLAGDCQHRACVFAIGLQITASALASVCQGVSHHDAPCGGCLESTQLVEEEDVLLGAAGV